MDEISTAARMNSAIDALMPTAETTYEESISLGKQLSDALSVPALAIVEAGGVVSDEAIRASVASVQASVKPDSWTRELFVEGRPILDLAIDGIRSAMLRGAHDGS